MQAGKLDRRVTLLRRSLTRNEYGEQVGTYETYDTVWAQKLDFLGREFFSAQKLVAENTTRFRIRWRSDIVYTDRLGYDGKVYDIVQIAEIGRRNGLEIVGTVRVL